MAGKFAIEHPYSILAMGPRTGKSVVSCYVHEQLGGNSLIVAPAYLVPNWRIEIKKWLGNRPSVSMFQKGADLYEVWDTDITLISYDLAMKAPHLFEWADNLFLDEVHKICAMDAKRTQFFHKEIFENSVQRLHLLSGTPIKNRVKEFYSHLALMNYNPRIKKSDFLDRFPDEITFADYFSYREEFTMEMNTKKGLRFIKVLKWTGLRRVPELKEYLKGSYLRVRSEDMIEMSSTPLDFMVSTSPDRALLKAFNAHFGIEGKEKVNPTAKAEAALKKVPFTTQYVEDLLEKGVKCVPIYSDHRAPAHAIAAKFGVQAITGDMPAKKRAEAARRFQAGETKVLVATIKSLSEGISLTRARDIVLNDFPWVPGDLEQTVMRLQGVDQKHGVTVHRIFGSPQDQYIFEALEEKAADIRAVTD